VFDRASVEARENATAGAPAFKSDHPVGEVASPFENGEAGFDGAPIDHDAGGSERCPSV
jgi:hypothetical protein